MRLANFAKLTAEKRNELWAAMDDNRRNALVGEAMGYRVVAHSWPCFNHPEGEEQAENLLPIKAEWLRQSMENGWAHLRPVYVPDCPAPRWPPEPTKDESLGCKRIADLEILPDFVGDMGAAWEIVGWFRKQEQPLRFFVLEYLRRQARWLRSGEPSRLDIPFEKWWFNDADWPEVLGRAVVGAMMEDKR